MNAPDSLDALVDELTSVAGRLRSGQVDPDEAAELVGRCADLAARVGAELDGRSRAAGQLEGQERLL